MLDPVTISQFPVSAFREIALHSLAFGELYADLHIPAAVITCRKSFCLKTLIFDDSGTVYLDTHRIGGIHSLRFFMVVILIFSI